MASAGARAYMGVWGLCPQRGPGDWGRAPGQRVRRGEAPPLQLKAFYCQREQICHSHSGLSNFIREVEVLAIEVDDRANA